MNLHNHHKWLYDVPCTDVSFPYFLAYINNSVESVYACLLYIVLLSSILPEIIFRYTLKTLTTYCHSICKKYQFGVPWLGWSTALYNKWLEFQFLVRAHNNLVVGSVPDWGGYGRQLINVSVSYPHIDVSPFLSF